MNNSLTASLPLLCLSLACSSDPSSPSTPSGGSAGQGAGGSSGSSTGGSSGAATAGSTSMAGGGAGGAGGANGGSGGNAGSGGATGGSAGAGGGGGSGGMPAKFVCPEGPFPAPMAAQPQQVCEDFDFEYDYLEGATWVASQNAFYFSNFVQGAQGGNLEGNILKYTLGGDCEMFLEGTGTNGLALANSGNLLGASHKTRSITEFDILTKAPKILASMYMTELLDSPNDLVQSANGTIYFSNPTYELGGRPEGFGSAIFRVDPQGQVQLVQDTGGQPNGVALSPKADKLYVVGGGVWDVDAAGATSNRQDFNLGNADGLAMDCAGNVYSSGGSIRGANGQGAGNFSGGTNLAFGGPDGKTLFVVGGGDSLKTIQMNVPGLP